VKVRVRFGKVGKVRWTSHRDVARMWERALRRANLAVAYTGGFSPRPKLSFGLALPTGAESEAEYLDVELADAVDAPTLPGRLTPALPVGLDVLAAVALDDSAPSLQQDVTSCTWRIEVACASPQALARSVERALDAPELTLTRERKGQATVDDVRPAILSLAVTDDGTLEAELATQPRGLRPNELLAVLDGDLEPTRMCRMQQWIERDGARWEPIPLDATDAPHAEERAS
jgi:radical SAM-linked protein